MLRPRHLLRRASSIFNQALRGPFSDHLPSQPSCLPAAPFLWTRTRFARLWRHCCCAVRPRRWYAWWAKTRMPGGCRVGVGMGGDGWCWGGGGGGAAARQTGAAAAAAKLPLLLLPPPHSITHPHHPRPTASPCCSGMTDVFEMLQSPTFCHHLGYGCMEIALGHLFPELRPLFRTLQHGGLG